MRNLLGAAAVALFFGMAGCTTSDTADRPADSTAQANGAATNAAAQPASPTAGQPDTTRPADDMRIEVDLNARQLHVLRNGARVETYPVAVGSTKWPTQTGEWTIKQAVWNPEWTPPDESWAEEREPRKPGDPKNPLGKAQLVYDPPRTIHGTNDPSSVGKPVSHGSIRVTNEVAIKLARAVMEAAGVGKDEAWYTTTMANTKDKQIIDLPRPIPIRVF